MDSLLGAIIGFFAGVFATVLSEAITLVLNGPQLCIEFDEKDDCWASTKDQYGSVTELYVRIRVTNTMPRTARECRAYLTRVELFSGGKYVDTPYRDSLPLIWSFDPSSDSATIPNGITRYIDVATYSFSSIGIVPQLYGRNEHRLVPKIYQDIFKQYGARFRLTVVVASNEADSATIQIVIDSDSTETRWSTPPVLTERRPRWLRDLVRRIPRAGWREFQPD